MLTRESQAPVRTARLWDMTPTSWWRGVWWPADLWGPVLVSTCTRQIEPGLELFVAIQIMSDSLVAKYSYKLTTAIFQSNHVSRVLVCSFYVQLFIYRLISRLFTCILFRFTQPSFWGISWLLILMCILSLCSLHLYQRRVLQWSL